ncbi:MAG TPA: hypothetical protein VM368_09775 [Flavisolibacter sp.]|nr:hypothetical protein [Flavisolibacter sp.]
MTKLYLLILSSLIFYSCKTASKSYQKGNYSDAIEIGIKKLQKDPNDNETKELVKAAYTIAVNQHEDQIRSLSNSKNANRYERIYNEYVQLQNIYQSIKQSPSVSNYVKPVNYAEFIETYGNKAAEVHVVNAEKWQAENTKAAYREAYNEYRQALKYKKNDVDLKRKRDSAYNQALTKVLVVPIQNYGGYNYSSSYQLQNFQNEVMRTLSYNMGSEFVKFYSEWDLRSKNLEPDQIMELNLGRIMIGRPYEERSERNVSKEVVVKETVYKPDSVVKQYATVRAKVITTRRTLISEGDLYITVRDVKGRILWDDRFTGQHQWQTEFASYTGDERALTDSDRSLLNRNNNNNAPREEEIMEQLYRQIQNDLSYRLRNYYSRY